MSPGEISYSCNRFSHFLITFITLCLLWSFRLLPRQYSFSKIEPKARTSLPTTPIRLRLRTPTQQPRWPSLQEMRVLTSNGLQTQGQLLMWPYHHWVHNYMPLYIPIRLANNSIVYSSGVGTVGLSQAFSFHVSSWPNIRTSRFWLIHTR